MTKMKFHPSKLEIIEEMELHNKDMQFILGYDFSDNANFETLTRYETTKEADYNTEEWCIVEADSLEEAKGKYEQTFVELKEKGLINGCM